ncbi:DNA-directed RNA polymerase subunit alpha C-terminal domain-containing protein [Fimbriiglobus ruber]|uniref:DNA-directed RNA polymerase subunit alpha C-terminal domain-containing protein n=1 Tax=Fimbriiglobus ruber TaxID=1908690 RepID=UPI003B8461EF
MGLSAGLIRILAGEGVTTAMDLCLRSADELLETRNIGEKRLHEVRDKLAAAGLGLSGEGPSWNLLHHGHTADDRLGLGLSGEGPSWNRPRARQKRSNNLLQ